MSLLPHGVHRGVPSEKYHSRILGQASKSALDLLHRSPAHYKAWVDGQEEEPTPALLFGAAFHCALLEPEVFGGTYAVAPDFGDCRFKENKARRDAWRAEHDGAQLLSADDAAAIDAMSRAVWRHPLAGMMMREGEPELTVRWRDAATGVECKARGDYHVARHKMLVDLKSTEDAAPEAFRRSIANYGYHRQDAFYRAGFAAAGLEVEHFVFVVVEKRPPHAVAVYTLDAAAVQRGADSIRRDLEKLAECMQSGEWPGYPVEIRTLDLPPWAA